MYHLDVVKNEFQHLICKGRQVFVGGESIDLIKRNRLVFTDQLSARVTIPILGRSGSCALHLIKIGTLVCSTGEKNTSTVLTLKFSTYQELDGLLVSSRISTESLILHHA